MENKKMNNTRLIDAAPALLEACVLGFSQLHKLHALMRLEKPATAQQIDHIEYAMLQMQNAVNQAKGVKKDE